MTNWNAFVRKVSAGCLATVWLTATTDLDVVRRYRAALIQLMSFSLGGPGKKRLHQFGVILPPGRREGDDGEKCPVVGGGMICGSIYRNTGQNSASPVVPVLFMRIRHNANRPRANG